MCRGFLWCADSAARQLKPRLSQLSDGRAEAYNTSVTRTHSVYLKVNSDEDYHSTTPTDDVEAIPDDVMPSCKCIGGFNGRYTLSCPHGCDSCHENQLCSLYSSTSVFKDPDCLDPYDQGFGGISFSSLLVLTLLFTAHFE
jgi:hypothetical protein